jgi:pyruvate dehydrogenase E1 component alpha subunit
MVMALPDEKLLELYKRMVMVRTMEKTHERLLGQGKIQLMGHFGTGQEAVAIGVTVPLRTEDILFGTHRGVGEFIGKGMKPADIWLEYMGKGNSLCKGKGGLHLCDKQVGVPGLVASLGADFSMAVGTALASKMQKLDQVTLYYVGEGTCNQGDAHPSMCMAALWKLPLVFAVCNNQLCEASYMCEHYPTEDVAPRAEAYGIPYEIVDGQDVELVYEATDRAVEHARSGKGPFLVEFKTFRMAPHFSGDPAHYVKKEDLDAWGKRDPLDLCRQALEHRGALSAEEDDRIRQRAQAEVDEAIENAFQAPDPGVLSLFDGVYAGKGVAA